MFDIIMANMKKFLRKYFAAAICLGIFSIPQARATIFTHTLTYSRVDGTSETLTGRITFDDQEVPSNSVNQNFDSDFITNVTLTYTNSSGNDFTVDYSDFTDNGFFDKFTFVAKSGVTPNFSPAAGSTLFSQLDNLQVGTSGGDFTLSVNATAFEVQATESSEVTDFLLTGTTYHSPAPLPLLAILPAFSSISKLKKRYNLSK